MNTKKLLETARKIRENDLPFKFDMSECATCIIAAAGNYNRFDAEEELGLDPNQAERLFFPRVSGFWKEIQRKHAADTIEYLVLTGEVDWKEASKIAIIVVPTAQRAR